MFPWEDLTRDCEYECDPALWEGGNCGETSRGSRPLTWPQAEPLLPALLWPCTASLCRRCVEGISHHNRNVTVSSSPSPFPPASFPQAPSEAAFTSSEYKYFIKNTQPVFQPKYMTLNSALPRVTHARPCPSEMPKQSRCQQVPPRSTLAQLTHLAP